MKRQLTKYQWFIRAFSQRTEIFFEHQAVLKVDLPEAKNVSAPEDQPNSFELVIDPKGLFYLNDRQLVDGKRATLEAAFLEAAGEDRNVPVILRADAETPHHGGSEAIPKNGIFLIDPSNDNAMLY